MKGKERFFRLGPECGNESWEFQERRHHRRKTAPFQYFALFPQFGDVERAVVIVDDRGKSTGEGIVEFARKPGAKAALDQISKGCFLMGT